MSKRKTKAEKVAARKRGTTPKQRAFTSTAVGVSATKRPTGGKRKRGNSVQRVEARVNTFATRYDVYTPNGEIVAENVDMVTYTRKGVK